MLTRPKTPECKPLQSGFIRDMGFKTGKGGYQKEYPPLYVLRPDGSTLYTYRDIVYSFKKASQSAGPHRYFSPRHVIPCKS